MRHVYVGWDEREHEAWQVACESIRRRALIEPKIHILSAEHLVAQRMLWRPIENRGAQRIDVLSNAPQSTEFANARFLVPFLHRTGWCAFLDCDVVVLADIEELFSLADDRYAVMCVQHDYTPGLDRKMDGCAQTQYRRKNWSSVVLWNCDHPAHYRLSLAMVNQYPGDLLHRFFWLRDSEIGSLPAGWNWLVGEQPKPADLRLAHFTNGGPWLPNWIGAEHDEIWLQHR